MLKQINLAWVRFLQVIYLMIVSCNIHHPPVLQGCLNGQSQSTVYLQYLTLTSTLVVDTAVSNVEGCFALPIKNWPEGIYAIKYDDDTEDYALFLLPQMGASIQLGFDDNNIVITNSSSDMEAKAFSDYLKLHKALLYLNEERFTTLNAKPEVGGEEAYFQFQDSIKNILVQKAFSLSSPYVLVYLFTILDRQDDLLLMREISRKLSIELPGSVYLQEIDTIIKRNFLILDHFKKPL